jgi:hypothetical protein
MKSLLTIVPKLRQATNDEKLTWEKHQFTGYKCTLGANLVRIWQWSNSDSETTGISVNLQRGNDFAGEILDSIVADEYASAYEELLELYSAARRSALNVDAVISEIEAEIDKL